MAGTEAKKTESKKPAAKQSGNSHYSFSCMFVCVSFFLYVRSSDGVRTKPCRCEEEGGEEGNWLRSHASEGGELRRVVFRGILSRLMVYACCFDLICVRSKLLVHP